MNLRVNRPGISFNVLISILAISICISSCRITFMSFALKAAGIYSNKMRLTKATDGKKEIVFIKMHHIGTSRFYKKVKEEMLISRNDGFRIYYESVKSSPHPINGIDTINLKLRKILGFVHSPKGYLDTSTHKLMGRKIFNGRKLVNQPKWSQMGIDTTTDKWADISVKELLAAYENKFGLIQLDSCDFFTNMNEEYRCNIIMKKETRDFLIDEFRNKHIAKLITEDTCKKILLIFGADHAKGVIEILQKDDPSWKIVEK